MVFLKYLINLLSEINKLVFLKAGISLVVPQKLTQNRIESVNGCMIALNT